MFASIRPPLFVALAALSVSSPLPARGQESSFGTPGSTNRSAKSAESTSEVIDDGGMFSSEAIRKAKATLARIDRAYKVAVTVETVESLRGRDLEEVAVQRAEQLNHKGIFILIARQDKKAEALASPRALRDELGRARLHSIRDAFTAEFRRGETDEGLIKGAQAAFNALAAIRPEAAREVAVTEGGTSGGTSSLVVRGQVRLSLAGARKAIAGAEAKAVEMKLRSDIAVVDDGGLLLAFNRMDGARPAGISTSQTKAISAATFRGPTGPAQSNNKDADMLLNFGLQSAASDSGGKITSLLGGLPIVVDGQIIGAIGVAGGSGEQDLEVAKAGVAAFVLGLSEATEEAKPKPNDSAKEEAKPKPTETTEPMPR